MKTSQNAPPSSNLREIITARTPLLDVRAPGEFSKGALPHSHNVAILDDAERAAVGLTYKNEGSLLATELGHQLVRGQTRQERIREWIAFLSNNPNTKVMCWRGGQRSQITQSWLQDQGHDVERVPGGYKALRNQCLTILEEFAAAQKPWWVVAGRTGVQKTVLINRLETSLDLEAIAHHRGSAFGAHATAQPALATFENTLAYEALNHHKSILVLEDESRTIGRVGIPSAWHERMKCSPLALIEASVESRVDHIVDEYVTQALAAGTKKNSLEQRYRNALSRIQRRLGGLLHQQLDALIEDAFANKCSHGSWVNMLLTQYYDPMYDYQLKHKEARIRFRGNIDDVEAYLHHQANIPN